MGCPELTLLTDEMDLTQDDPEFFEIPLVVDAEGTILRKTRDCPGVWGSSHMIQKPAAIKRKAKKPSSLSEGGTYTHAHARPTRPLPSRARGDTFLVSPTRNAIVSANPRPNKRPRPLDWVDEANAGIYNGDIHLGATRHPGRRHQWDEEEEPDEAHIPDAHLDHEMGVYRWSTPSPFDSHQHPSRLTAGARQGPIRSFMEPIDEDHDGPPSHYHRPGTRPSRRNLAAAPTTRHHSPPNHLAVPSRYSGDRELGEGSRVSKQKPSSRPPVHSHFEHRNASSDRDFQGLANYHEDRRSVERGDRHSVEHDPAPLAGPSRVRIDNRPLSSRLTTFHPITSRQS
jgi:hypothetical protein